MVNYLHVVMAVVVTIVLTLFVANLMEGEKRIDTEIKSRYAVDDPQYLRAMGVLLGPTIVKGNRVQYLENGDDIFPSMLAPSVPRKKRSLRNVYLLVGRRGQGSSPTRLRNGRAPA